jgi:hypothetical protein
MTRTHAISSFLALAFAAPGLFAQGQTTYTGKSATGELTLFRTVNITQLAQTLPPLGAVAFEARSDERLPQIQKRLHPPMGASRLAPLAPLGATASIKSLPIVVGPAATGFDGLTQADQRLANNGNQLTVEPPNTNVAVANGYVLQGVNNALQVYTTTGTPVLARVVTTNEFFGLAPALYRPTNTFGPFPTDMRVFYDAPTNRWFVLQRVQDSDTLGFPIALSHIYLAVSQTSDPRGSYNVYSAVTTNSTNPGCPCFSDYLQIGADQYGFYVSANEYSSMGQDFIDATILAISKTALASGATTPAAYRFTLPFTSGFEFAIQPAATPPGASYFLGNGGQEYFVSTVGSFGAGSSIALWAMWNTSSLATGLSSPTLARITVPTLNYAFPDFATQPAGPRPYGESLNAPLPVIYIGDTRALSQSYKAGRLHLTFPTLVLDEASQRFAGGAYIVLSPTVRNNLLAANVIRQDYLIAQNNHLLFPVVAINAQGRGAVATTVVGPTRFPSAAYVPIDNLAPLSSIRIPAVGKAPEDGFTGYANAPFLGAARWGDYASAMIASDGTVWMASEYIGDAPRTQAANWQTFIMQAIP